VAHGGGKMEIAIVTSLLAKRNVKVDAGQILMFDVEWGIRKRF
jgi:hypothetical protein